MTTKVPTFKAPGVQTIISATTPIQPQVRGITTICLVHTADEGRDNLWLRHVDYNAWQREIGGSLNYSIHGQAQQTANRVLSNGAVLTSMIVKPGDAKYAHLVVGVLTKKVNAIDHPTDPGTPIRASVIQTTDPDNLESGDPKRGDSYITTLTSGHVLVKHKVITTSGASNLSSVENFFAVGNQTVLQDGYELNKLILVTPPGRGKAYRKYGIQLSIDRTLDNNYAFRVYRLQFVQLQADGGVSTIPGESIMSVAFDPTARDNNGNSLWIEDVVRNNSKFILKFNTTAYLRIVSIFNTYKETAVSPYEYDVITGLDRPVSPGTAALTVNHNEIVFTDEIAETTTTNTAPETRALSMYQRALSDFIDRTGAPFALDGGSSDADNTYYVKKSVLAFHAAQSSSDSSGAYLVGRYTGTDKPDTLPDQMLNDTASVAGKDPAHSAGSIADKLYGLVGNATTKATMTPVVSNGTSIIVLDPEDIDVDLANVGTPSLDDVIANRGTILSLTAAAFPSTGFTASTMKIHESDVTAATGQTFNILDGSNSDAPINTASLGIAVGDLIVFPEATGYAVARVAVLHATGDTSGDNYSIELDCKDTIEFNSAWRATHLKYNDGAAASGGILADLVDMGLSYHRRDTLFATGDFVELTSDASASQSLAPYSASPSLYATARAFYAKDDTQWDNSVSNDVSNPSNTAGNAFSAISYVTAQRVLNATQRLFGDNIKGSIAATSPNHTRSQTLPNFDLSGWSKLDEYEGNNVVDWFMDGGAVSSYFFAANIPTAARGKNFASILGTGTSLEDLIYYMGAAGLDEGQVEAALGAMNDGRALISGYNRMVNEYVSIMADQVTQAGVTTGDGGFGAIRTALFNYEESLPNAGFNPSSVDVSNVLSLCNTILVYCESVATTINSIRTMSSSVRATAAEALAYFGSADRRGALSSATQWTNFTAAVATLRRRIEKNYNITDIVSAARTLIDTHGFGDTGVLDAVINEFGQALHERQKVVVEKLYNETNGLVRLIFDYLRNLKQEFVPFSSSPITAAVFDDYITVIENKIGNIQSVGSELALSTSNSDVIDWDLPVYLAGGSDGSLDTELYSASQRAATLQTLLAQAYGGTIVAPRETRDTQEYLPSSILNKDELYINILLDANYPTPVKLLMSDLARARGDCMAWLDCKDIASVNGCINYRRRELPVVHYTTAIFAQNGEVVDPSTGQYIRVTSVHEIGGNLGLHDQKVGIGGAIAGRNNGQVGLTRANFIPRNQDERDRLYDDKINHFVQNDDGAGVGVGYYMRSQLTSQGVFNVLSEIPNVRVIQEMVRVCERITRNYEFIRFIDEGGPLYRAMSNEMNLYLQQYVGEECSIARAVAFGSAADRISKLTRVAIEVKFNEFSERFLIVFGASFASE